MRTTIRLDDELLAEVKLYAARSGKTMAAVIEDSLRAMLARQQVMDEERKPMQLNTIPGKGLQPGVDLDNSAALLTLMEEANDSA